MTYVKCLTLCSKPIRHLPGVFTSCNCTLCNNTICPKWYSLSVESIALILRILFASVYATKLRPAIIQLCQKAPASNTLNTNFGWIALLVSQLMWQYKVSSFWINKTSHTGLISTWQFLQSISKSFIKFTCITISSKYQLIKIFTLIVLCNVWL